MTTTHFPSLAQLPIPPAPEAAAAAEPRAEPEAGLIHAAIDGNLSAFNALVVQYQGLAYNMAYRILGDPDAAADATQDGFLKAYRALNQFRGDAFKPWLLRIIINTCYDHLRRARRRPATSLEALLAKGDRVWTMVDRAEGPEASSLRRELAGAIESSIDALPTHQRTAVLLSDVHGLHYDEIAAATNVSIGTVKSRLARGRARLRDALVQQRALSPGIR